MALYYPRPMNELIEALTTLPGVGPKGARRIAHYLLKADTGISEHLADALVNLKKTIRFCSVCGNITDQEICSICEDEHRDKTRMCVVAEPQDIYLIEQTGIFNGLYHVLMGLIAPTSGVGPSDLRINELKERLAGGQFSEVIIATNPSHQGEITALHLHKELKPLGVRITRLATGLPTGADIEYADRLTLRHALQDRKEIE